MASRLAKDARERMDHTGERLELAGINSPEEADEFAKRAFEEPFPLEPGSEMLRINLVVGAGKGGRSKFSEELPKWIGGALRNVGIEEDKSAAATVESAGSYKYQHDTGANLKIIVVYPKIQQKGGGGGGGGQKYQRDGQHGGSGSEEGEEGEGGGGEEEEDLSRDPEWLVLVCEPETFSKMLEAKMPAWMQKRRVLDHLRASLEKFRTAEKKLMNVEELDDTEQRYFDKLSSDNLEKKITLVVKQMKSLVADEKLTEKERDFLLDQVNTKLSDDSLKDQARKTAEERKAKLEAIKSFHFHELAHGKELEKLWQRTKQLQPIADKAGEKGRWSGKLSTDEVRLLGEKEEKEEQIQNLLYKSRCWYEEEDEFEKRVAHARKRAYAGVKKGGGSRGNSGGKKASGGSGGGNSGNITSGNSRGGGNRSGSRATGAGTTSAWSTVPVNSKKGPARQSKPVAKGSNPFGSLDSDTDSD